MLQLWYIEVHIIIGSYNYMQTTKVRKLCLNFSHSISRGPKDLVLYYVIDGVHHHLEDFGYGTPLMENISLQIVKFTSWINLYNVQTTYTSTRIANWYFIFFFCTYSLRSSVKVKIEDFVILNIKNHWLLL